LASIVNSSGGAENAQQAIEALRSIYSKTVGYDYGHIRNPKERDWLTQSAESRQFRPSQQPIDENKILERLTQVQSFELFLHRLYPGKTRFSIEGVDLLIPMLNESIPTVVTLRNGKEVGRVTGVQNETNYRTLFKALSEGREIQVPITQFDRLLRLGAGALFIIVGISANAWILDSISSAIAFTGMYDRCPIWKAVTGHFKKSSAKIL